MRFSLIFLCLVCGTAAADQEICLTGIISQNGPIVTYSAKCCPEGTAITFQGLPGLKTGSGCGGDHCFVDIKIQYGITVTEVLVALKKDNELLLEILSDLDRLKINLKYGDNDEPEVRSGSTNLILARRSQFLVELLGRGIKGDLATNERAAVRYIIGKYVRRVTKLVDEKAAPGAVVYSPKGTTQRVIPVYGFDSELERFGYDDSPLPVQSKKKLKDALADGCKLKTSSVVRFKHPTTNRYTFLQLVVVSAPSESAGQNSPPQGGGFVGFGFEVEPPKKMDGVQDLRSEDVIQLNGQTRHCMMIKHGSLIFGVACAEHRKNRPQ